MGNDQEKSETFKLVVKRIDIDNLANESFEYISKNLNKIYSVFYDKVKGSIKTTYALLYEAEKSKLNEIDKEKEESLISLQKKKWVQIYQLLMRDEMPTDFIFNSKIDNESEDYKKMNFPKIDFSEEKMKMRMNRIKKRNLYEIDSLSNKNIKEIEDILIEIEKVKKEKLDEINIANDDTFLFDKLYKILSITINLKIEYHFHIIYLTTFQISNELIIRKIKDDSTIEYNFEFVSYIVQNSSKYMQNMVICIEKKFNDWKIYTELFKFCNNIIDSMIQEENFDKSFMYFENLFYLFRINTKFLDKKFWGGDNEARPELAKFFNKTIYYLYLLNRKYKIKEYKNTIEEYENNLLFLEIEYSKNYKLFFHNIKYKLPNFERNIFFKKINTQLLNEVSSKYKFNSENFQLYWNQVYLFDLFDDIFHKIETLQHNQKNYEISKDFIRKIIFEFHNSQLLIFIFDELSSNIHDYYNEAKDLIEGLIYLVNLDFVIIGNYINCDIHIRNLLLNVGLNKDLISSLVNKDKNINTIYIKEKSSLIISTCFKLLIHYHLKTIDLHLFHNLTIFIQDIQNKNKIVNDIYELFQNYDEDLIKFNISLLILTLSLNSELYYNFTKIEVIKPTSHFINTYIRKVFSKQTMSLNKEKSNIDLSPIVLLIDILETFCDELHFRNYYSTNVFYDYLDSVLLLYYINHPQWNNRIIKILNHFLFFYQCKAELIKEENNSILYKLQSEASKLITIILEPARTYLGCCYEIERLTKEIEKKKYKQKYLTKLENDKNMYFQLVNKSQNKFFECIDELPNLVGRLDILINLCLVNDFETRFGKVFQFELVDKATNISKTIDLYSDIKELDGLLGNISKLKSALKLINNQVASEEEEKQNNKLDSIVTDYEDYIYKITIIRMIKEPFSNVISRSIEGYKINDIATFIKFLEQYYDYDYDLFHKIVFSINRFIMYIRLRVNKEQFEKELMTSKILLAYNKDLKDSTQYIKNIMKNIKTYVLNDSVDNISSFSLINILFQYGTPSIINREILRLLCTLSMFSNNLLFNLPLIDTKYFIDYSNINEIKLEYRKEKDHLLNNDPDIDFNYFTKKKLYNKEIDVNDGKQDILKDKVNDIFYKANKIISLPFKNIPKYNSEGGIIQNNSVGISIPRLLYLPFKFTIEVSYYILPKSNELNADTRTYRTLIVSKENIRTLYINKDDNFCIRTNNNKTYELKFKKKQYNKWMTLVINYIEEYEIKAKKGNEFTNHIIAYQFCSEGKRGHIDKIEFIGEQYQLCKSVYYIGNNITLNEGFGVYSDIKIYNECYTIEELIKMKDKKKSSTYDIKYFYSDNKSQSVRFLVKSFSDSKDYSNETLSYAIKLFNNLLSQSEYRIKNNQNDSTDIFYRSDIFMKIAFHCKNSTPEIKKEISKYWKIIE